MAEASPPPVVASGREYRVAFVGHSLVTCEAENPNHPLPGVFMRTFRVGGARVDRFFTYPMFRESLEWRHDLTVLMIGGNDIAPNMKSRDLINNILEICSEYEKRGSVCVWCTIESRVYPEGHKYYVDPDTYRKLTNVVNRELKKKRKGKIVLMGGRMYDETHRVSDGIHPNQEGRARIWEKIKLCIQYHKGVQDRPTQ